MGDNRQIGKFELVLEHDADEEYQYKPGEQLKGEVVLVVNDVAPLNAHSIVVELRGEAQVSWQQRDDEDAADVETRRDDDDREERQRSFVDHRRTFAADVEASIRSRQFDKSSTSPSRQPKFSHTGRRQLCTAVETYIDERCAVWASVVASIDATAAAAGPEVDRSTQGARYDGKGSIVAGKHRYPFEFQLPSELPSSFRGQYGNVGYAVRAMIMMSGSAIGRHRLAGGRAAVVSRPFFVKRRYTTSLCQTLKPPESWSDEENITEPLARRQSTASDTSSFEDDLGHRGQPDAAVVVVEIADRQLASNKSLYKSICCVSSAVGGSGGVRAEFIIPTGTECRLGGYFRVDIRVSEVVGHGAGGRSRWPVSVLDTTLTETSLVQVCTFISSRAGRRRTVALVSRRTNDGLAGGVGGNVRHWNDFRLSVPINLPESGLPGCTIIDVSYELRFVVEIPDRSKLKARLPVTIYGYLHPKDDILRKSLMSSTEVKLANSRPNGSARIGNNDQVGDNGRVGNNARVGNNGRTRSVSRKDLGDDIVGKFRRPIVPGETRQNLIYNVTE